MHPIGLLRGVVLVLLVLGGPCHAQGGRDAQGLSAFAERTGLRDVAGFVGAVQSIRGTGRLPPRYVTKDAARGHGWHGGGLCQAWPGHTIGGDVFNNFGHKLPERRGRLWHEADLDGSCSERGAKRLLFSDDGLIYVTVDHYNSFIPVPSP